MCRKILAIKKDFWLRNYYWDGKEYVYECVDSGHDVSDSTEGQEQKESDDAQNGSQEWLLSF